MDAHEENSIVSANRGLYRTNFESNSLTAVNWHQHAHAIAERFKEDPHMLRIIADSLLQNNLLTQGLNSNFEQLIQSALSEHSHTMRQSVDHILTLHDERIRSCMISQLENNIHQSIMSNELALQHKFDEKIKALEGSIHLLDQRLQLTFMEHLRNIEGSININVNKNIDSHCNEVLRSCSERIECINLSLEQSVEQKLQAMWHKEISNKSSSINNLVNEAVANKIGELGLNMNENLKSYQERVDSNLNLSINKIQHTLASNLSDYKADIESNLNTRFSHLQQEICSDATPKLSQLDIDERKNSSALMDTKFEILSKKMENDIESRLTAEWNKQKNSVQASIEKNILGKINEIDKQSTLTNESHTATAISKYCQKEFEKFDVNIDDNIQQTVTICIDSKTKEIEKTLEILYAKHVLMEKSFNKQSQKDNSIPITSTSSRIHSDYPPFCERLLMTDCAVEVGGSGFTLEDMLKRHSNYKARSPKHENISSFTNISENFGEFAEVLPEGDQIRNMANHRVALSNNIKPPDKVIERSILRSKSKNNPNRRRTNIRTKINLNDVRAGEIKIIRDRANLRAAEIENYAKRDKKLPIGSGNENNAGIWI